MGPHVRGRPFGLGHDGFVLRGPEPFEEIPTTLPRVIVAYFVAGILGGALAGVLWEWSYSWYRLALVGFVGGIPAMGALALVAVPAEELDVPMLLIVALAGGLAFNRQPPRTRFKPCLRR